MNQKLISKLLLLTLTLIVSTSCDETPEKNEKGFQENLTSFTSSIDKVDSTLDLMDQMEKDIDKIEEERALGVISDDEAIEKLNEINNTLGRQIAKTTNNNSVLGLPRWARKLGLTEPIGLIFDNDFSQATSERNEIEGFNSVILVYHGNYSTSMNQAAIIAKKANIPLSQDYKDAIKLKEEYGVETIKGASYMNFEIGADNNPQYNISITVDNDGTLTINATDAEALFRQIGAN